MRKNICISILFVLMMLLVVACGNEEKTKTSKPSKPSKESKHETKAEDSNAPETKGDVEKPKEVEYFASQATIEETVIYDKDDIRITAQNLEYSGKSATLSVLLENNTDKAMTFYSCAGGSKGSNSINRCNIAFGYICEKIEPGKKALKKMTLHGDDLLEWGMTDIAEIGLSFGIQSDDNDIKIQTEVLTIKTSIYDDYDFGEGTLKNLVTSGYIEQYGAEQIYADLDYEISENGTIISNPFIYKNSDGDHHLFLEINNQSGGYQTYVISNIVIDGITVNSGWYTSENVADGYRGAFSFSISYLLKDKFASLFTSGEYGTISLTIDIYDFDGEEKKSSTIVDLSVDESIKAPEKAGTKLFEKNGLSLSLLPVVKGDYDYIIPILVCNDGKESVHIMDEDDSLSFDDYMLDYICFGADVEAGMTTILGINIDIDDAEDIGFESETDFKEGQIELKFRSGSDKFSEKLELTY